MLSALILATNIIGGIVAADYPSCAEVLKGHVWQHAINGRTDVKSLNTKSGDVVFLFSKTTNPPDVYGLVFLRQPMNVELTGGLWRLNGTCSTAGGNPATYYTTRLSND